MWADEHQGLRLRPQLREPLHGLRRSLPRVVEANRLVEEPAGDAPGELLVVVDPQPDAESRVTLKGRDDEPRRARIDGELAGLLRASDVVRVRMAADGAARVLRVYPPEARILFA